MEERVRVLGIVGSPRRGGNTEVLVDEVLAGASAAGAMVEKVVLNELDIRPCQACNGCAKTGQCVQKDDMAAVLKQMEGSQVWVMGTPVYWWGPSAQFKAFMDRWYGARGFRRGKQRVVLTIPLGGGTQTARHTVGMFEDALAYLSIPITATIVAPNVYDRGAVRASTGVLQAAREAGRKAVQEAEQ